MIILYIVYIIILLLLALPYIPDLLELMARREISLLELRENPIFILGMAALLPASIIYIIFEFPTFLNLFKSLVEPFKELDREILIHTSFFLILQIGINILLIICLLFIQPDLLTLSDYSLVSRILVWTVSLIFSIVNISLNIFIGWKRVKSGLEKPKNVYWIVGYFIYFLTTGIGVIFVQSINPNVKGILLWPVAGIAIVGALSYFVVTFGLFLIGLEVTLSPLATGQGDAWIGAVFMAGILFMLVSVFLPVIHLLTYTIGVFLAKRKSPNLEKRIIEQNK